MEKDKVSNSGLISAVANLKEKILDSDLTAKILSVDALDKAVSVIMEQQTQLAYYEDRADYYSKYMDAWLEIFRWSPDELDKKQFNELHTEIRNLELRWEQRRKMPYTEKGENENG